MRICKLLFFSLWDEIEGKEEAQEFIFHTMSLRCLLDFQVVMLRKQLALWIWGYVGLSIQLIVYWWIDKNGNPWQWWKIAREKVKNKKTLFKILALGHIIFL